MDRSNWGPDQQNKLESLVPSVVIAEFERNRPRAEPAVTSSVLDRFRQVRQDLHEFAGDQRIKEWLEEMAHHVPMVSSGTVQKIRRDQGTAGYRNAVRRYPRHR